MAYPAGLVHLDAAAVPGTHALVIGVGKYPYLIGGEKEAVNATGMRMRQLSSPPVSARAFATWMIKDYHFPAKPLASLSLLLSEETPRPFENPRTEKAHEVATADIDTILMAVKECKARADSNPGNRLIFYFCGHGISESDAMALLAADFNPDADNSLNQAFDLPKLMGGLRKRCRASEQVFFIDTCRSSPDRLITESDGFAGQAPLGPGRRPPDWPPLRTALYYATLAGHVSHARPGQVSLFTDATLRGLSGVGSDNPRGTWQVTTSRLHEAIDHFMAQQTFAGNLAGVQIPVIREGPVFDLHELTKPPVVPVYIVCPDSSDTQTAVFRYRRRGHGQPWEPWSPDDTGHARPSAVWKLDLEPGDYEFQANVSGNIYSKFVQVRPVYCKFSLEPQT